MFKETGMKRTLTALVALAATLLLDGHRSSAWAQGYQPVVKVDKR
jgi:hypothetical protein